MRSQLKTEGPGFEEKKCLGLRTLCERDTPSPVRNQRARGRQVRTRKIGRPDPPGSERWNDVLKVQVPAGASPTGPQTGASWFWPSNTMLLRFLRKGHLGTSL